MKMFIKNLFNRAARFYEKHPGISCIAVSLLITFVPAVFNVLYYLKRDGVSIGSLKTLFIVLLILSLFIAIPIILTLLNLLLLFFRNTPKALLNTERKIGIITVFLGILYSTVYLSLDICHITYSDWYVQIYNSQMHTPIFTEAVPTVAVISATAILGHLVLRYRELQDMPPLVITLCIAAMYLGAAQCVVWIIQIWDSDLSLLILCLLPFNFILIVLNTMKAVILKWRRIYKSDPGLDDEKNRFSGKPLLSVFYSRLLNSYNWPWIGLLLSLPLLGLMIIALALFGQAPDSFIKAWTETAEWNLSQRIAPQNLCYDEHYLCTVAAGGHKKAVKPLRLGIRHGHKVIVNRQLCIANAFEQILEERTPNLHRAIRGAYDKYGYPFAKNIKSPYAADIIYFVMKPFEWIFLSVIYLCDSKPENRIALQYIPQPEAERRTIL